MTACSPTNYLLVSNYTGAQIAEPAPEITETAPFKALRGKVNTVAVHAPDSCSNQTADTSSGNAASLQMIIKTRCGVEMAEIEKELSKAGYHVVSWTVLAHELLAKSQSSMKEIGQTLNADVIFQINSFEESVDKVGTDGRWERKVYLSNPAGNRLEEAPLEQEDRGKLTKKFLESRESGLDLRRLAITIDASAVEVKTGESIWYYRWTHSSSQPFNSNTNVLVRCKLASAKCRVVPPHADARTPDSHSLAADTESVTIAQTPENAAAAEYSALRSIVIKNLIVSFAGR
jgi:hypothetical protein